MSWLSICFIVLEGHAHRDQQRRAVERELVMFHSAIRIDGMTATDAEEQGPGHGDPVEDVGEVPLGRRSGSDAGDVPALFADDVGLLVGIEGDVDVEEREEQDEDEVDEDVEEAGRRDVVVDRSSGRTARG